MPLVRLRSTMVLRRRRNRHILESKQGQAHFSPRQEINPCSNLNSSLRTLPQLKALESSRLARKVSWSRLNLLTPSSSSPRLES